MSLLMAASMLTVLMSTQPTEEVSAANDYGLVDKIQDGNILHCFCWKYNDIKAMLPEIAEAGFTSIQTSPPQSTGGTGSWWWVYQPLGFYIGTNALGTKDELKALCDEAHKYGIKIVADIVANHLAGDHSRIQDDLKDSQYWHQENYDSQDGDRYRVTHGKIGMPDLATENSHVQQCVAKYVQELKSVGVDGIRWDAAKHIGLPSEGDNFWPTVTADSSLWNYGEILNNPGVTDEPQATNILKEYTKYMTVTDSTYGMTLRDSFKSGQAPSAYGNLCAKGIANNKLLYWGESHDTWSNNKDWGFSNEHSQNVIDRAYAVAASRNEITALYFSRPSSAVKDDITLGDKGSTHFTSKEVAAVNHFHNAMVGQKDYYTTGSNCSVVTREKGAVVVAGSGGNKDVSVPNGGSLCAPGTYTDEVTGNTWTVTSTTISGKIGDTGIAVIYNPTDVPARGGVSATPATGTTFTTDTLSVTLGAKDVTNAKYTTSEGASGSYTDGQKITVGASTAVGGTVKVTLSGTKSDGSTATAEYIYTKKDPNAVTKIYFDNSSYNWSNVYAYVYGESGGGSSGGGGTTVTTGDICFTDSLNWGNVYAYFFNDSGTCGSEWPGTQMSSYETNPFGQTNYKISIPSGATSVVFNNGNGTQTGDLTLSGVTGYYLDGSADNAKPWDASAMQSLSESTVSVKAVATQVSASSATENAAWPGVAMTKNADGLYEYKVPDNLVNGRVIFSDGTNSATNRYPADMEPGLEIGDSSKIFKAGNKWENYTSVTPTTDPTVTADKASGSSFTTETYDVTLGLSNAVSGTYSVDNGPTKTFTSATKVTIGEGKIGDSDVTIKATATDSKGTTKNYTFTYKKTYVKKTSSTKKLSTKAAARAVAATAAGSLSNSSLAKYYSTNGKGVGKEATITIDGDFSDWSEDMLIAQGAAWDVANHWKGGHENCVLDTYALYAAWDNDNLYVAWQMVNTTDTWAKEGDGSLSDGGRVLDVPLILALSIDPNSTSMSNKNTSGGSIWGQKMGVQFDSSTSHVDRLFYMSGKPGLGKPSMFKAVDSNGNTDYEDGCVGFTEGGIEYKMAEGNICSSIMGLNSSDSTSDVCNDGADWVDYKTFSGSSGTHNTKYDSFYEIKIPLSTLGITKDYITNNGIGAMLVATRGESGLDCIPFDVTMLDNATGDYHAGDNTSLEKEDEDVITAPLANVGKGSITPPPPPQDLPLQVNFGADRSAPQEAGTALTLKGIGYGGSETGYKYEFIVDGTTVQASSSKDSYTWNLTSGKHTIQCVITDSKGATATTTKTYTAEGGTDPDLPLANNSTISATSIKKGSSVTMTAAATGGKAPYTYTYFCKSPSSSSYTTLSTTTATTYKHTPANTGSYSYAVKVVDAAGKSEVKYFTVNVSSTTTVLANASTISATSITKGSSIKLTAKATGGTAPYKYRYYCKPQGDISWTALTGTTTATSYTHKPARAISYQYAVKVADSTGKTVTKYFTVKVNAPATPLANASTISATSITKGSSIKLTAKATGGTAPYKYRYFCKPQGDISWTALTGTTTATSYTHKPARAITYQYAVKVADSKGTTVTKYFTVKVSASAALANASTISATSITKGQTVTMTAKATGGTAPYKYRYFCKPEGATSWTALTNTTTTATCKHTPARSISYQYAVKIADSTGKTVTKYFTVNVK